MKAAVVENTARPPRYRDFSEPNAASDEVMVTVKAAALSQLVRAQASGNHYTSAPVPFVPGADGVGLLDNGQRVYFAFSRAPVGAMAERVAVKADYTVALADDVDDITAAAIANPGMSSWAALTERAHFKKGETVLINGATGASGRLAIQIAKYLGASRIVVTGRNPAYEPELLSLGADVFIPLASQSGARLRAQFRQEIGNGIDVVLDYLWGPSSACFIEAASGHGQGEAAPRIRFVNIGSLGGPSIPLPAAALRSSGLELTGSGLGSIANARLVQCIGEMIQVYQQADLQIDAEAIPLQEVEHVWAQSGSSRVVFTLNGE